MSKEAKGVTPAQLRKIALSFPEANEKPSYGKPSFFIAKKFFTRYRKDDNSLVFIVADMPTRDMMLELDPKTYFITDHYRDYPSVLVRMERITPDELKLMLERRWRQIAPKKLVKEVDESATPKTKSRTAKKKPAATASRRKR
ncbi:MAG TPA: MmcQ/YjbR family DNA-binding protein [Rhizomicrobium sp.]|nr:MmcQ/YjbR family DNA-binding protein [Rhizomicrobium sp.]